MVFLATVAMFVLGLSLVRTLVKVLLVPRSKLMPIVFILCLVGSFAIQQRFFDIGVMVVFGILGYFMREMDYPMAPMVLGIVLGDILDKNLRRALVLSDGRLSQFFKHPISLVIIGLIILTIISRMAWFKAGMGGDQEADHVPLQEEEGAMSEKICSGRPGRSVPVSWAPALPRRSTTRRSCRRGSRASGRMACSRCRPRGVPRMPLPGG